MVILLVRSQLMRHCEMLLTHVLCVWHYSVCWYIKFDPVNGAG